MRKLVIPMELDKATPNTLKLKAVVTDSAPAVRSLYLEKWAAPNGAKKVTVTVEIEE